MYTNRSARGFTLPELMATVAIVAVLATLAVVGVRKYITASRVTEAHYMMGAIRTAEEAYRAETMTYLTATNQPSGGSLRDYYPSATPDNYKRDWLSASTPPAWKTLNVVSDGPVMYGYAVVAGLPGQGMPVGDIEMANPPTSPTTVEPWFLVQAKGDTNHDNVTTVCLGASIRREIICEGDD